MKPVGARIAVLGYVLYRELVNWAMREHRVRMPLSGPAIMLLLRERATMTVGEIAPWSGVTNVSYAVHELEKDGLVVLEGHPSDRRCKVVRLTERGRTVADGMAAYADRDAILNAAARLPRELAVELRSIVQILRGGGGHV